MQLLILLTGNISPNDLVKLVQKALPIFESHGIKFSGQFVFSGNLAFTVSRGEGISGLTDIPMMWIVGLNPDQWFGYKLRSLEEELTTTTGIKTAAALN